MTTARALTPPSDFTVRQITLAYLLAQAYHHQWGRLAMSAVLACHDLEEIARRSAALLTPQQFPEDEVFAPRRLAGALHQDSPFDRVAWEVSRSGAVTVSVRNRGRAGFEATDALTLLRVYVPAGPGPGRVLPGLNEDAPFHLRHLRLLTPALHAVAHPARMGEAMRELHDLAFTHDAAAQSRGERDMPAP